MQKQLQILHLALKINNKARVDELDKYGWITFMSEYSSIITFNCQEDKLQDLIRHPIVESYQLAPSGSVQ